MLNKNWTPEHITMHVKYLAKMWQQRKKEYVQSKKEKVERREGIVQELWPLQRVRKYQKSTESLILKLSV